jgi:predicted dehydrogenase
MRAEAASASPAAAAGLREINVALLGAGAQGQVLMESMLRIPGLRFRAVCDIWTEYNQRRVVGMLKRFKHEVNGYEDYREMLDKEKELDAVIIATPDFWHAQHALDCLAAGKHVYCEKEMSNTNEGARSMVAAARKSGKLMQIGHQRRSNPRYLHCYNKLLHEAGLLGRIVTISGQWNRAVQPDLGAPDRYAIPASRLKQYGFKDMHQFRNWRWYKGLGGGPIVDLGSHQIDIYSWYLGANPSHVMASGGNLYYDPRTHEWYDTVMVVYDYDTPAGPVKAFYQTQTTNGSQGYFESFMGDHGTLLISESELNYAGRLYRDPNAPPWDQWIQKGYVSAPRLPEAEGAGGAEAEAKSEARALLDVRESVPPEQYSVPVELRDPYHQPHLQNFFDAVRGKAELTCPPEVAYETAVAVLKVNEAIEARSRLSFRPEDFRA